MKKILNIEFLFVALISLAFAILNQWHVISEWLNNKPGQLFTGIVHFYSDYFLYADQFAQGSAGQLFTQQHFTNEPLPTTWIYWFNAALGFIGGKLGLNPFASYNLSLFLLVILLCLLWYYFSKLLYPTSRVARFACWLLILSASSFFDLGKFLKTQQIELLGQFWFSPTPAFNRLGGVPHQVFQTILFVSLIILFSRVDIVRLLEYWVIGVLVLLAATANPVQMVLVVTTIIIIVGLRIVKARRGDKFSTDLSAVVVINAVAILGIFLTNQAFNLPVLAAAKAWENGQQITISLWQFFLSIGPIAPFFLIGLTPFFKKPDPLRRMVGIYGVLSLLMFFSPIPQLLGTTNARWLHPAPYAFLSIVATEGVRLLSHLTRRISHLIYRLAVLSSYCLIVLFTLLSLVAQITARASDPILRSNLNHVPREVFEALTWLKQQPASNKPVVLTDPALPYDVLVPVLSGKISFTGHPLHTLYPVVKENLRQKFFNGEMSETEAQKFLTDHRIGFIIKKNPASQNIEVIKIN